MPELIGLLAFLVVIFLIAVFLICSNRKAVTAKVVLPEVDTTTPMPEPTQSEEVQATAEMAVVEYEIPKFKNTEGLRIGDVIIGNVTAAERWIASFADYIRFNALGHCYIEEVDEKYVQSLIRNFGGQHQVLSIDWSDLETCVKWLEGRECDGLDEVLSVVEDYIVPFKAWLKDVEQSHREARSKAGLKVDKKRFKPMSKIYLLGEVLYAGLNAEPWTLLCHLKEPFFEDGQMKNVVVERGDGSIFKADQYHYISEAEFNQFFETAAFTAKVDLRTKGT